jgi:monovalent cation:H+ antiporter-2, CPA2 family
MIADLILLLALTVPAVLLFRRLRLPSIAGILTVGAIVGPHGLAWVDRTEEVEELAEIGVTLLLFTIGLELSLPKFFLKGKALLTAGALQMVATAAVAYPIGRALGLEVNHAILLSMLVAPSSTAFVLKVLSDTRQIDAPHGGFSVGILIFQDLCVIPLMLALPLLTESTGASAGSIVMTVLKALGSIVAIVIVARYVFPRVAKIVMKAGGRELFTLFVVLTALAAAWATARIGLSLALGAFVAGLFIAESEYSHQVVAEILPFRDVCNALFFIAIGMLFDVRIVLDHPAMTLGLVALLVAGKALVMMPVAYYATRSATVSWLSAAALAQVGEFSFVLLSQSEKLGIIESADSSRFLAIAILSMLASPFVIQAAPKIAQRLRGESARGNFQSAGGADHVEVVVLGYGLNGENVARVLQQCGVPFRVVELNIQRVELARQRSVSVLFGDGSRVDVLERAGLATASVLVIAVADPAAIRSAIAVARRLKPTTYIIVRTRYMSERDELLKLGADEVIPEEFETSIQIFSRVLMRLGVPRGNIAVQVEFIRREGYQMLTGEFDPLRSLDMMREILAETSVETMRVADSSPIVGRSLAEVDLRAKTGASVISAVRNREVIQAPGGDFVLDPDCVLVVTGNHEQLAQCRDLIAGRGASE